jgi:hypothetical protein
LRARNQFDGFTDVELELGGADFIFEFLTVLARRENKMRGSGIDKIMQPTINQSGMRTLNFP